MARGFIRVGIACVDSDSTIKRRRLLNIILFKVYDG